MSELISLAHAAEVLELSVERNDVDSLARLLGGTDRRGADLIKMERSALTSFADDEEISDLARRSLLLLAAQIE